VPSFAFEQFVPPVGIAITVATDTRSPSTCTFAESTAASGSTPAGVTSRTVPLSTMVS
jgi:hypothetical protein